MTSSLRALLIGLRGLGDRADLPFWSPTQQTFVTVPLWNGGLSFQRACEEEDTAWDLAETLWKRLGDHSGHQLCEAVGTEFHDAIRLRLRDPSTRGSKPPLVWRRSPVADTELTFAAGHHLKMAVDTVMQRVHPVFVDGKTKRLVPDPELRSAVEPYAAKLIGAAMVCLRVAGEPLDEWRQAVVVAHLLAPELALFAVSFLFWHPPPPPGQTDQERQHATAIGSPDKSERAGVQAKRDFQRLAGFKGQGRKRGPKPGSVPRQSPAREQFDKYVLSRLALSIKSLAISRDAEARRLYRLARNDRNANLTDAIVRAVGRRHR